MRRTLVLLSTAILACLGHGQGLTQATELLLAGLARRPPGEACVELERALAGNLAEADRQALLLGLVALAPASAAPPSDVERNELALLTRRSLTGVGPLAGRYALVLGTREFRERALAVNLVGKIDAACVLLRQLFGVDPVALEGHRFYFFPEAITPGGWTMHGASLTVRYPHGWGGGWDETIAHELSHGFLPRHPALHAWAGGFGEGWADFVMAYVGERLAFLGEGFEGRFAWFVGSFEHVGRTEYLETRLPIEEIVAYGPSSSVLLRLCLEAGEGQSKPDWTPLERWLNDSARNKPCWMPGYLWPVRLARDLEHAFPSATAWNTLAAYRFPLDGASRREVERWEQRARKVPYPSRGEQWSSEGHEVVRGWRVLGPIPDAMGRDLDFDPLDAWNGARDPELTLAGTSYTWASDVTTDEHGSVDLSKLPRGTERSVTYLAVDLSPALAGWRTFYIASDDAVAVWLDGELINLARESRAANPDEPDRAYGNVKKEGSRLLVQVANYGGLAGLHVRTAPGTGFDTSWRAELRSSDERHRLLATRFLGSRRVVPELVLDYLIDATADADTEVRRAAAWALGGKRNEPRAVEALIAAWTREKQGGASDALRVALEELTFQRPTTAAAASKWWKENERAWRAGWFVEAELAYTLRSIFGGFFGNNAGSFGGQHVGRCWGGDPGHGLTMVLEASEALPRTLALRYSAGDGDRVVNVRVRRGEHVVHELSSVPVPRTTTWTEWRWLELPVPELAAGRYRVELWGSNGCLDWDVIGWKPAPGH